MANAMLVHQLLRLEHGLIERASHHLASHQIVNVPVGEPGSVLGEGAHDVALGNDSDQRSVGVADREGANVERAQPCANRHDRFLGNASRESLLVPLEHIRHPHEGPPLLRCDPREDRGGGRKVAPTLTAEQADHQSIVQESAAAFWSSSNGARDFRQSWTSPRSPRLSWPPLSNRSFIWRRRRTSVFMNPTARAGWSSIASM